MTPEEEAEWAAKLEFGSLFEYQQEHAPPQHGRYQTYNYHGCRCTECRAANAAHGRAVYAAKKAQK